MRITVLPVGVVKKFVGGRVLDLPDGADGRLLIERLALPVELKVMSFVNGRKRPLDQPLANGDEVKLISSLGGG